MPRPLVPFDFETPDETAPGGVWPFFETDGGDIIGFGHGDPASYAAAVTSYDLAAGLTNDEALQPSLVKHEWLVVTEWNGAEPGQFVLTAAETPEATPVTVVSRS